jgi:hypothetical protein
MASPKNRTLPPRAVSFRAREQDGVQGVPGVGDGDAVGDTDTLLVPALALAVLGLAVDVEEGDTEAVLVLLGDGEGLHPLMIGMVREMDRC